MSTPRVNPYYSLRRQYIDEFCTRALEDVADDARVLDVGGHRTGRRGHFDLSSRRLRATFLNIDYRHAPHVIGNALALPFRSAAFDMVLCSELLEHVPDAAQVVVEIARVLRRGGIAVFSAPFMHQLHADPDDYARFTPSWWRRTLTLAGLEVSRIEAHGAYWSVLADMLRALATEGLARSDMRSRVLRRALLAAVPTFRRLAVAWDRDALARCDSFHIQYATGFGVIAYR